MLKALYHPFNQGIFFVVVFGDSSYSILLVGQVISDTGVSLTKNLKRYFLHMWYFHLYH